MNNSIKGEDKLYHLEEWRKRNLINVLESEICERLQITKEQLKKYDFTQLERIMVKRSGKPLRLIIPCNYNMDT